MSECSIDAKFVASKKGTWAGKTKCGKGTKLVAITDKRGRHISILISSASCHEVGLVEPALGACFTSETPAILTGDKAYGYDPLNALLRCRGVEMVPPTRKIVSGQRHRMFVYAGINAVSKLSVLSAG